MRGKTYKFFLLFLLLVLPATYAQYSPGVKWRVIETEHFKIIFPEELKPDAERIANTMEHIYKPIGKTLNSTPGKYPLLIINTTTTANGFVRIAPKESIWYHLPPIGYDMSSGEWFNILATHETRHMVQNNKADIGFTRLMHILFGEIGQGIMETNSMPRWFEEGDAVTTETALTDWGRGRLPDFNKELRAILLENKKYSYNQMALSSFSYGNHYPNIYKMGFYLVAFARNKYGAEVWSKIINRTSYLPFIPLIFNISTILETGNSLSGIYNECMNYLRDYWGKRLKKTKLTPVNIITHIPEGTHTNYINPIPINNTTILAIKLGIGDPRKLVEIKIDSLSLPTSSNQKIKVKEKVITEIAPLDNSISYSRGKVIWSEKFSDPFWNYINYADIILYELTTGKRYRLTTKRHLFVPTLSPGGNKIASVEYNPDRSCSIVISKIEEHKGKPGLKDIFRLKANHQDEIFGKPSWSSNGNLLVFTRQNLKGKTITLLNLKTRETINLLPYSWHDIRNPIFYDSNYILYQASYTGIDNIFAININSRAIYQITSRKYAAQFPAVYIYKDNKRLIFSDYSVRGFNIGVSKLDIALSKTVKSFSPPTTVNNYPFVKNLVKQEQGKNILKEKYIPTKKYRVRKYNPFLNLINIHSWGLYPMPLDSSISITGFLLSDDTLGIMEAMPWINYNITENTWGGGINLSFKGILPHISITQSLFQRHPQNTLDNQSWISERMTLLFSLPIDLSESIWSRNLTLSSGIGFAGILNYQSLQSDENTYQPVIPFNASISFYNHIQKSRRDIYPRFGEDFYSSITLNPFPQLGNPYLIRSLVGIRTYLPGIFNHNSVRLSLLYLNQSDSPYRNTFTISNIITYSTRSYPRGYPNINQNNIFISSIEYTFPIFYPDLAFGPIIYFSRLRANIFLDNGTVIDNIPFANLQNYTSTGIELTVDFVPLMLPVSLNWGVRLIYRITDNTFRIEDSIFSFGIDF